MRTDVIRLDLRLRRRSLIGTAGGATIYLLLIVGLYPSFKNDSSVDALVQANPAGAAAFGISGSLTSASGWLGGNMYANIGPLLALLLTIGYGASAIAGEDEDGLLGLLTTLPLTRSRIVLHKALALLVVASLVPVASLVACLAGPRFELTPDWTALIGVTLTLTLLAVDLGAIALLVGALTGSRSAATAIATAISAAMYLISSLAPVVDAIHTIRWLSPFYWAVGHDQLAHGIHPGDVAALLGLGAALLIAAHWAFQRYDIR